MRTTITIEDIPTEEYSNLVNISVKFSEPMNKDTPITPGVELVADIVALITKRKNEHT